MVDTKYDFQFSEEVVSLDINRLTNQLWKLIPMRENNEDWNSQLKTVINEISGLGSILNRDASFLVLISKLEGLSIMETDFSIYRKTVFEAISLLREIRL